MSFDKRILLPLVVLISLSYNSGAQTLFTYGNKSVSKQEFLKAYHKNNADEKPSQKSYRDYLDLYSRFKIKVQAALDLKLDTLSAQKTELSGFRNQISDSYMNDEASINLLVEEAISRSQKDIHVAHIFIPLKQNASDAEIKNAENKIKEAHKKLQQQSFEKVAIEFSEDPAVKVNKGDIGHITVFVLPYDIENVVYSTAPGKFSSPFRSKVGFHIIKNLGERPAVGTIKAAHILLAFAPDITEAQQKLVELRADSLHNVLRNGGNFKELALQFSNDNLSYQNGGELLEFGVGRYQPEFQDAAFALVNDGDISTPIRTEFGYHIIKRLEHSPIAKKQNDPLWRDELKQHVLQSDRAAVSRKIFLKKIQEQTSFTRHKVNQKSLWQFTDSVLQHKHLPRLKDVNLNTPLFGFSKRTIRVKDWQNYLESIHHIENLISGKTNAQLLEQFIETATFEYYRDHLEFYNKDFVSQLNEFKEGNLLFEIMQRKIWDVAASDSIALKRFYQQHKNKYWWEASADAIIVTCSNQAAAEEAKAALLKNFKDWKKVIENSNGMIQGDSGRFELAQIPVPGRTNFTPGLLTADVINEADSSVTFSYIITVYMNREARSFEDSRGFVINDYQAYLEEKWVAELKKKYPIKINEAVLSSLSEN